MNKSHFIEVPLELKNKLFWYFLKGSIVTGDYNMHLNVQWGKWHEFVSVFGIYYWLLCTS
jgi:hypothetical protein